MTKKDGTVFTIKGKQGNRDNQSENKNTYGFSAEQLEGLRVMQQAGAYRADGLTTEAEEIEPPAPASIKRARITERLGRRANAAHAEQDTRTTQFLAAINKQ